MPDVIATTDGAFIITEVKVRNGYAYEVRRIDNSDGCHHRAPSLEAATAWVEGKFGRLPPPGEADPAAAAREAFEREAEESRIALRARRLARDAAAVEDTA